MKVEIWSDVMCPFCYMGKRNIETALEQFSGKDQIEIEWKSFQLDPSLPEIAKESSVEYIAKSKGLDIEQVRGMLSNVAFSAKQVGLDYNFEKWVMVNSLNAQKFLQFAKTKGMSNAAEERLFYAFFTEGKNLYEIETLVQLGVEIGLDAEELKTIFTDDRYLQLVNNDIEAARKLRINGVPFFVFDRKYAISGAQPPQKFLEVLTRAFGEWETTKEAMDLESGKSCNMDGTCS